MSDWKIIPYSKSFAEEWNRFAADSRNGTFLFDRRFMDYHSDRFRDCSLLALYRDRIKAVLPANLTDDGVLHSHQGLTYGGWLTPRRHFDGSDMMRLFEEWLQWAKAEGISEIDYKPVPFIYWSLPAAEDEYALWRFGAVQSSVLLSSAFRLADRPRFEERQVRNLKKALRLPLHVQRCHDPYMFMSLVETCLRERHGATPVHTGAELDRLCRSFPENITLWTVSSEQGTAEAGVCIFNTGRVVHSQYIASTTEGRDNGALAFLFDTLINHYSSPAQSLSQNQASAPVWFDFGTSNEDGGFCLNEGLLCQKTELGGRGVVYRRYKLVL